MWPVLITFSILPLGLQVNRTWEMNLKRKLIESYEE